MYKRSDELRLAILGDTEKAIEPLVKRSASLGYDVIAAKSLTHELAAKVHAIIYVTEEIISDSHRRLDSLVDTMHHTGLKRLLVCTPGMENSHLRASGLDWTVIESSQQQRYDNDFASFVVGQVTDSRGVKQHLAHPVVDVSN